MRALLVLMLAIATLAGCADQAQVSDPVGVPVGTPGYLYGAGNLTALASDLFAGPALYPDPQNAPHPAFNWPTIAYPAVGDLPNRWWTPAPASDLPAQVTGLDHVAQAPGVPAGAGIAIFGSIVVVPGFGEATSVVDISDPRAPEVLSSFKQQEGLGNHRGAAMIAYPDGRLVTVISTPNGIDVWNITDPSAPTPLPVLIDDGLSSHKVGVIPGTPIVVNARSSGGSATDPISSPGVSEMWDLSDPEFPVRLPDFSNGYGCHHVYFWNDVEQDKFRGVCAGIQYTQIWDTSDPYSLSVISSIPFTTAGTPLDALGSRPPPMSISHYAGLSMDGTILLIGDESGGGSNPPGCVARVDVPGVGAVSVPIGAIWFYDVSVETQPELLGWYSASQLDKFQSDGMPDPMNGDPQRSCTAHHGRLVPVEGRDLLAMSWYNSGVIVVDFSNVRGETPGLPVTVAQFADNSDTWETWYYNGYLYTGDLARGMDVLALS